MLKLRSLWLFIGLTGGIFLTSCQTQPTVTPPQSDRPTGDLIYVAEGNGPLEGNVFAVPTFTRLNINWNYGGHDTFALWLINHDEEVADPQYDRILVIETDGPTDSHRSVAVIAGHYSLDVELANGEWKVEVWR